MGEDRQAERQAENGFEGQTRTPADGHLTTRQGEVKTNPGEVSFELPASFMGDVRASVEGAMAQVTEVLPSLSDILSQAQLLPGVGVERARYLEEQLRRYPKPVVERAVALTPAEAGIPLRKLSKLARKQQGKETRRTTMLSFAAGFAGGAAAAAAIPADLAQFYGHIMRMIQMLTYLFGWRDLCALGEGGMHERTRRAYLLFLGVMAGDEVADGQLVRLAPLRARDGVGEALMATDEVSVIEQHLSARMAQRVGGQVVGKSIPIAGAIISGTISFGGFSDMCKRLRTQLAAIG